MPWRNVGELQIFAPSSDPFGDNWVEQILGSVLKPLQAQFGNSIRWWWITRYAGPYDSNSPPLGYDIPETYRLSSHFRYVLFRASVEKDQSEAFRNATIRLSAGAGCFTNPSAWINYDVVTDLGNNRFIEPNATDEERIERARLIAHFMDAALNLMLHSLVRDENGKWMAETNSNLTQNPQGAFFQSVHHLFCNLTDVPTSALLMIGPENLLVTTDIALSWNLATPLDVKTITTAWGRAKLQF